MVELFPFRELPEKFHSGPTFKKLLRDIALLLSGLKNNGVYISKLTEENVQWSMESKHIKFHLVNYKVVKFLKKSHKKRLFELAHSLNASSDSLLFQYGINKKMKLNAVLSRLGIDDL